MAGERGLEVCDLAAFASEFASGQLDNCAGIHAVFFWLGVLSFRRVYANY